MWVIHREVTPAHDRSVHTDAWREKDAEEVVHRLRGLSRLEAGKYVEAS